MMILGLQVHRSLAPPLLLLPILLLLLPTVVAPPVVTTGGVTSVVEPVDPPVVTDGGVASVVTPPVANTKVATGNYEPTVDPKTGAVTDRLGNPVVTNAKGYGYFDPITGLAVTPGQIR
jgi:uncharacterized membrane protein